MAHQSYYYSSIRYLSLLIIILLISEIESNSNGKKEDEENLLVFQTKAPNSHAKLEKKDSRWPNRQLNVLIDTKSLNGTEQQVLSAILDQIEHKTCLKVNRLSLDSVNPFLAKDLPDSDRHFIYIFKSPQIGLYNRSPSIGLSSFGCVRQGRQSLVLTDLAFRWPGLVLKYHILRSLGVEKLERPDSQVKHLLNILPFSQKISNAESNSVGDRSGAKAFEESPQEPAYLAYATLAGAANERLASEALRAPDSETADDQQRQSNQLKVKSVEYLDEEDLTKLKELYECSDFQNRLSLRPLNEILPKVVDQKGANPSMEPAYEAGLKPHDSLNGLAQPEKYSQSALTSSNNELTLNKNDDSDKLADLEGKKLRAAQESVKHVIDAVELNKGKKVDDSLIDEAAKSIVSYLLAENFSEQPAAVAKIEADNEHNTASVALASTGSGSNQTNLLETQTQISSGSEISNPASLDESKISSAPECKPLESCPLLRLDDQLQQQERSSLASEFENHGNPSIIHGQERPMMLKLDPFHAKDPQLQQANQMKLSQLSNTSLEAYNLLNAADLPAFQQGQQSQQANGGGFKIPASGVGPPKSEMLISFEQASGPAAAGNPIAALVSSQILKLCSCTCQTMTPSGPSTPATQTRPTTEDPRGEPSLPPLTDDRPTWPPSTQASTEPPSSSETRQVPPGTSPGWSQPTTASNLPNGDIDQSPSYPPKPSNRPSTNTMGTPEPKPTATSLSQQTSSTTATTASTTTNEQPSPSTTPLKTSTESPLTPLTTEPAPVDPKPTGGKPTPTSDPNQEDGGDTNDDGPTKPTDKDTRPSTATPKPLLTENACDQVQWVKPNKTVYASAKIVWDVDRANQNYFLCNNMINGELVPGKTHGFSCKISSEGKAFEVHNFSVLTKPEHVNLAWVQKNSETFGKTNFPVIGGYSKTQDPYIMSRCLVRDENNDVITLIGYVNNQGVGWFPFDDIQIECAQYDVLACVS